VSPGSFKFYKHKVWGILSIYLITVALAFLPLQHAPSHQWSTSPPKQKGLSLVGPAICLLGLLMAKPIEAPLASDSLSPPNNQMVTTNMTRRQYAQTSVGHPSEFQSANKLMEKLGKMTYYQEWGD
jgi:hypothetical protein